MPIIFLYIQNITIIMPVDLERMPKIDAHTHIFPEKIFDAIWTYFEHNYWQINYRYYAPQIDNFYKQHSFERYTTLNYAHKPDISAFMNLFTAEFCKTHSRAIPLGTIHPGDKNLENIAETALTSLGMLGFKFQLLVTDFYAYDDRLKPVYDLAKKEDKILVFHAGTGPIANNFVGIKPFIKFLDRYPDLRIQIAHFGCFEYEKFFELLKTHPNLMFDSAMIMIDPTVLMDKLNPKIVVDQSVPANWNFDYHLLLEYEFLMILAKV